MSNKLAIFFAFWACKRKCAVLKLSKLLYVIVMEQLAFWVQFWVVTMTWLLSQAKFSWSSQDCVAHWLCFMTACSGTGGREGIEDWSEKSFDTVLSVVVSRKSSSLWYRNDIKSSCFGKAWLFFIGTTHLDLTLSVLLDWAVGNGNF